MTIIIYSDHCIPGRTWRFVNRVQRSVSRQREPSINSSCRHGRMHRLRLVDIIHSDIRFQRMGLYSSLIYETKMGRLTLCVQVDQPIAEAEYKPYGPIVGYI